jgi:hypothetical protein
MVLVCGCGMTSMIAAIPTTAAPTTLPTATPTYAPDGAHLHRCRSVGCSRLAMGCALRGFWRCTPIATEAPYSTHRSCQRRLLRLAVRSHDCIQLHVQTEMRARTAMRADRHVHALASDAVASLMRAAAYARGGDGDNECPTRYYRIVNEAACQSAATAARERYERTVSDSGYPSGCFSLQGGGAYLNTHPTGSDYYPGAQLLCSGATLLAWAACTLRNSPMAVLTRGTQEVLFGCARVLVARLKRIPHPISPRSEPDDARDASGLCSEAPELL